MAFRLPDSEAAKLDAIGAGVARAQQLATGDWRDDDVERWLTDHPLPADFVWNGERAYPRKQLLCGYGQWLRTAGPYHPALRGLYRLCCDILIHIPVGRPLPSSHELAALLLAEVKKQASLPGVAEDTGNPPETHAEPTPTPAETDREPSF